MAPRVPALLRRLVATTALAVTASVLSTPVLSAPAGAEPVADTTDVTMVQANILTGMSFDQFSSDLRTVHGHAPDFVTYNEVPYRQDQYLAPDGYALHRSKRNRYTAATPVAWRTDRWTKVNGGTFKISGYTQVPDGKHTKLGLRFANWVTLRSADGRQLSVVSVHLAPLFKQDGKQVDLLRPSVSRLGELVGQLAPAGPVLVGGDFNVHYKSGRYPRDLFSASGLVPTYDTLGRYFPTGDHQGATIDYVLNRGADQLRAVEQHPDELKSDHDAVIGGFDWQVDAPAETEVLTNDPDGPAAARRAVVTEMTRDIESAGPGMVVEVVTADLTLRGVYRRLVAAVDRGVHVRLTTRSEDLTRRERRLRRHVTGSGDAQSWVRRCRDECLQSWRDAGVPRGFVLVRDPSAGSRLRVDVNRNLNRRIVANVSKMVTRTGRYGLAEGEQLLASVY